MAGRSGSGKGYLISGLAGSAAFYSVFNPSRQMDFLSLINNGTDYLSKFKPCAEAACLGSRLKKESPLLQVVAAGLCDSFSGDDTREISAAILAIGVASKGDVDVAKRAFLSIKALLEGDDISLSTNKPSCLAKKNRI